MNDFLSNLVSKSLSAALVIQPRPISLFEPWQPGGALDMKPTFDRGPTDRTLPLAESDVTDHTRFADRPRREPHDRFAGVPRTVPAYSAPAPEPIPQSPPMTLQAIWASAPAAPHETVAPAPIDQPAAAAIAAPRTAPNVAPSVERVIGERSEEDHDRAAAPVIEPSAAHASPLSPAIERIERVIIDRSEKSRDRVASDHEAPRQAESMPITQPHVIDVNDDQPTPSTITPPRVTPRIERVVQVRENGEPRQVDRVTETAQPPQPTIHVTIGRIEVRATSPATPLKRASPPVSTLTLEEYLRSRAGDRR